MAPWPQAIASFYLGGTPLLLLLLNRVRELGTDSASPGLVVMSSLGLVAVLMLTAVRLVAYARAVRRPDVVRRRGPLSEPIDSGRAVRWAVIGAAGLLLFVLADRLVENRAVGLTVALVGLVLVGLSYWHLWRTPLRPMVPRGAGDEVRTTRSKS